MQANSPPRQVELQIRDVALSVLVRLTAQNLREYGPNANQPNANASFGVPTLIFPNAAQRETTLKKWAEWRAQHPDA